MTYTTDTQQAPSVRNRTPIDEQAAAQADLYSHLEDQAQEIAPEELTTLEINSHHYEVYAGKWLVAYITYDYSEFATQPWVVMVNGVEKFRHNTQAWCLCFIDCYYKDGTLNPQPSADVPEVPFISEICFYEQEALVGGELVASVSYSHDDQQNSYWQVIINNEEIFTESTPARCHSYVKQQYQAGLLPVQQPFVEPCTTGNEIMCQIAQACEQFGLELLDDGVYRNDTKLGEAGCTDEQWWFVRADESQEKVPCDSAMDAVYWLSMTDTLPSAEALDYEQLLDLPFDQLTSVQWEYLQEYESMLELVAA
ncbi:hypothetical protein [Anabaena sp. UHCC 0399]|uniref:hypothetical protein n=1 Tax=Anabaena sp. UHCC 0399 TaxID=3110238 RepID=UPI002B1F016B|nr:hypothetical protein [Anabaena sp. UHCC 0399]MEA5566655.1 hypothetical protein [Anabaena sp. UHCC 0399]